jgi:hypothetical protein
MKDEAESKRFLFCQRWLVALGVIIVVFGVALAFLYPTPLFDIFRKQIDPVFWAAGELTGGTLPFQQWIYGVLGATMAGWGVCIAFIAAVPFKRKKKVGVELSDDRRVAVVCDRHIPLVALWCAVQCDLQRAGISCGDGAAAIQSEVFPKP